ncbi:exosortase F system-associated membrane protein [Epilithonimonas pallida]|uniref:Exosortase F-associated protein n=1 Tax=Epilithonimonas pallida TaxID=373671 RepID=A0ABY1QZ01_9FLAO|nr:exosortase F system-associated protein [Epilithonimonas pallida]SMP90082.1 exosortase F-associated protein [Epilithonimonas pallida]
MSILQCLKFPKILRWFLVICGILGLIAIRGLEDKLFYDPFLHFFKSANQNEVFPNFIWEKLILSYLLRFGLNTFFSLVIVHFLFQNKDWTKQAFILIALVFLIVFPIYLYCIYDRFQFGYLFSFYVRRFVIQPLTVILLIPVFYYRKKITQA